MAYSSQQAAQQQSLLSADRPTQHTTTDRQQNATDGWTASRRAPLLQQNLMQRILFSGVWLSSSPFNHTHYTGTTSKWHAQTTKSRCMLHDVSCQHRTTYLKHVATDGCCDGVWLSSWPLNHAHHTGTTSSRCHTQITKKPLHVAWHANIVSYDHTTYMCTMYHMPKKNEMPSKKRKILSKSHKMLENLKYNLKCSFFSKNT